MDHFSKIAALNNLMEVADYLKANPKLNIISLKDKFQSTLLHHCAFNNQFQKMKVLLKHLKFYYQNNENSNRFEANPFKSNSKAWINQTNNQGYTALHYACLHGNVQMLKYLEDLGANIYCKSNTGQTIMHMCSQNNQLSPLLYLYRKGLDFNQTNKQEETILHQSSQRGFVEIVNFLLALSQVQIDKANANGETALILATKQNKAEVVKRLLIKGIDKSKKNNEGETALKLAKDKNYLKLEKILTQQYTCVQKSLILCNKKIVYRPEDPSLSYVLLFIFLLFTSIASTHFLIELEMIQLIVIAIFYLLLIVLYVILLQKPETFVEQQYNLLLPPICAQCKINQIPNSYHCFICRTCIYRYDHHCPWINSCVGFFNIGKFTTFLFLLIFGLIEIGFVNIYQGYLHKKYRLDDKLPLFAYWIVHIYNLLLVVLFLVPIILLFITQMKNLFTNTTQYERSRNVQKKKKKQSLLNQESTISDVEEQQDGCSFGNCIRMCSQKPQS